ncbi:MAG: hypothetical protein IPM52_13625 [Bacteroidetes bacterium]|nr:hypothetical protein [Bacteroidota bacterium]
MKHLLRFLFPVLLLSCSAGQQTTKTRISAVAGINLGGMTENTDMSALDKQADAYTGATRAGFHAGLRAAQSLGPVEFETGAELMNNRQHFTYHDADWGYEGRRDISLNQLNIPFTIGFPVLPGLLPQAGLRISAGYLLQFNHLHAVEHGLLPDYSINKRSSGATLSFQGNLLNENGKPRIGLYGSLYRGSRVFTDPYNPTDAEMPGTSFGAIGLRFYLFSR